MPISSKMPNFPIQSAHAIKLAVNAAKAKVEELQGRGFYKVWMTALCDVPCICAKFGSKTTTWRSCLVVWHAL